MTTTPTYHTLLHYASKFLSVILYPLFIPTYGMLLFCLAISHNQAELPLMYTVTICLATFILTCVIPLSLILYMWMRGQITDLYIEDPQLRTMPYLYSIMGFGFWCWFVIKTIHAPYFLQWTAVGSLIAIVSVLIINRKWKISAHLCGMGGLVGGMLSYAFSTQTWPILTLGTLAVLSLLLMYARIYLKAHTPAQVVAGFLLGLSLTTLPYFAFYV